MEDERHALTLVSLTQAFNCGFGQYVVDVYSKARQFGFASEYVTPSSMIHTVICLLWFEA
jgi:hypothetical protein